MMLLIQLEAELRSTARRRIEQGQLPSAMPPRIWGGYGTGQVCALCDRPIQPGDVEFEVDERAQGVARTFRFHRVCQAIWQIECVGDTQASSPSPADAQSGFTAEAPTVG